MATYLSRLNPVPSFPEYTGPYKVGTIDVELPVSELELPSPRPDESISTIQYRIFYPCEPESKSRSVYWIPAPQRGYVSAYGRFVGAGSMLAEFISYFPRILHYISIPAQKNATLLQPPTSNSRWPVMIFSHGLGGSRNAYSHLVGSVASHGMIVIALEHRDGSTPISYIRDVPSPTPTSEIPSSNKPKKTIDYVRLSHTPSPEVEEGRNAQLRIRLWEMGLVHDSLLKLDQANSLTNLNASSASLSPFASKMDVHTPGKITFAGHSFGAATATQFVKSVFYSPESAPSSYKPLFVPSSRAPILSQITPQTPVVLLDAWCMPLRAETTRWLWNKPFPCYSPGGPGGAGLLAIESQGFFKWRVHLKATKRLLSPDPSSSTPCPPREGVSEPHFLYAKTSAHLSQSDFGILFPWLTKKFLAIEEPDRILRLNVRAITQMLRDSKIEVSETSHADMEIEDPRAVGTDHDEAIFKKGAVRGWEHISIDLADMADVDDENESKGKVEKAMSAGPGDAVVEHELRETSTGITVA
ncbi:platelet-activating factor acetylhydrolase [Amylocarpus encephaloides]|uniref:Putative phospholipase n=1 Tax=Amylocarpus encephaloides TaxID=45428 RepID=A0A9P8C5B5_9HELO|nr:platelet-activating factor acetylhydrolase [Amylocarpus encephaloides]